MLENDHDRERELKRRQQQLEDDAIGLGLEKARLIVTGERKAEEVAAFGGDKTDGAEKRKRAFLQMIATKELPRLKDAIAEAREKCGTKSKYLFDLLSGCGTDAEIAGIVIKAFFIRVYLETADNDDDNENAGGVGYADDETKDLAVVGVADTIAEILFNQFLLQDRKRKRKLRKRKQTKPPKKDDARYFLEDMIKPALLLSKIYISITNYYSTYYTSYDVLRVGMTDLIFGDSPSEDFAEAELENDITVSKNHAAHLRLFEDSFVSPTWPPMLMKPKEWVSMTKGGYTGALSKSATLIKNRRRMDGFSQEACPEIFAAINYLQATPFRINTVVFSAFSRLFGMYTENLQQERFGDSGHVHRYEALLGLPEGMLLERSVFYSRNRHWWRYYGLHRESQAFQDDCLHFVHTCDFRGRVYPKASSLNYQSGDLQRSLLVFGEKKALANDEAVKWLKRHGANCYAEKVDGIGIDKSSFDKRECWVDMHQENILALGRHAKSPDPFNCLPEELEEWWLKADKPWAFLAWAAEWTDCHEWISRGNAPTEYPSCLPIEVDGSSNGYQHISALLRSKSIAQMVNMLPQESPSDIYAFIADKAEKELKQYKNPTVDFPRLCNEYLSKTKSKGSQKANSENIMKQILAASMERELPRKAAKKIIMTYPYSATLFRMAKNLRKETGIFKHWTDEEITPGYNEDMRNGYVQESHVPEIEHCIAQTLASLVCERIRNEFTQVSDILDWFKKIGGKKAAGALLDICWKSPSGFPVQQHYEKEKSERISVIERRFTMKTKTGKPNPAKHSNALGPNFIHSCDAAHLVRTVNSAHAAGIASFRMIHDSYATHAADIGKLAGILREEFIKMYGDAGILDAFRAGIMEQCNGIGEFPSVPQKEDLDLSQIRDARYFFA